MPWAFARMTLRAAAAAHMMLQLRRKVYSLTAVKTDSCTCIDSDSWIESWVLGLRYTFPSMHWVAEPSKMPGS